MELVPTEPVCQNPMSSVVIRSRRQTFDSSDPTEELLQPEPSHPHTLRVAADVGGTFTDVAVFSQDTGQLNLGKVLTTPSKLVQGIDSGLSSAGGSFADTRLFLHGATVAINTILERTGARCALLTTRGFRDMYEIGRINRPESYNLFFKKHQPLINRASRFEFVERVDWQGRVLIPLDEDQVLAVAKEAVDRGAEAIAILFLHSYRHPDHEKRAKQLIEEKYPHLFVTASHELSQEYREFERTSTTAANAYVGPRVRAYLSELRQHIESARFNGTVLMVQSNGGLFDLQEAQQSCIRMLESGPAAGVTAAKALCDGIGLKSAIAFDMGGTTAKAGVIHRGQILMTGSSMIGGYATGLPVQIPMIDIQEVGTGGGSIARVDAGALHVGPESAGADPGPVCYGRGGNAPTVTDANLVLGRIAADRFLGGDMRLDPDKALHALTREVAEPLGIDVTAAADGILRIATVTMSHVVRGVTTERGLDAADFALISYGGAGPLHASMIARELRIAKVIIPRAPGHFSAWGMLGADLRRDFVVTWFTSLAAAAFDEMESIFSRMEEAGRARMSQSDLEIESLAVQRAADMRYIGQEHAVTVDIPLEVFRNHDRAAFKRHFDDMHEQRYGYSSPREGAEIVSLRSAVSGVMRKPSYSPIDAGGSDPSAAATDSRPVYFADAGGFTTTPTFARERLKTGNMISGPALVEEYASTTVLHPGDVLTVDAFGNLVIDVRRA
jgi:N-methylhydantoinase A